VRNKGCSCANCLGGAHSALCRCAGCQGRASSTALRSALGDGDDSAEPSTIATEAGEGDAAVAANPEESTSWLSTDDEKLQTPETEVEREHPSSANPSIETFSPESAAPTSRPPPRPKSNKPRRSGGKPLAQIVIGEEIVGSIKTVTGYGAFVDIGYESDGLLHISRISNEYVSNIQDVLRQGDEVSVRVVSVDLGKRQVGLSMRSVYDEERAEQTFQERVKAREAHNSRGGGAFRSKADLYETFMALYESDWDSDQFVEGEVRSTVDFGAFVNFDTSQLNPALRGSLDGLVHISALSDERCEQVDAVVKKGDKVMVRIRSLDVQTGKIALSMITKEAENTKGGGRGGDRPSRAKASDRWAESEMGAKDWRESLGNFDQPDFSFD
jgi:predicted RNA-binding protein with RPS1 domain